MKRIIYTSVVILSLLVFMACSRNSNNRTNGETYYQTTNQEGYNAVEENAFQDTISKELSTFSIDVDTASYSNVRRLLNEGSIPPKGAIRTEEMINYFTYDYPSPEDGNPLRIISETAPCPWNEQRNLTMIAIQGEKINNEDIPPNNLVFLLDVSGSMADNNKLPLVKSAMKLLVNSLREEDKISIVVYAGAAGVVLDSTSGNNKEIIFQAIDHLSAGGSTAGGQGIQLAYSIAQENFLEDGNNRIILATDGDFNVGIRSESDLESFIETKRDAGVYLSVLGFGTGNYQDSKMELLADKGNGNYAYIDTLLEAQKVLIEQMGSTLLTIAKDVKIQIDFNPATVKAYRLIGYENRILNDSDFNDDKKDAGELGAGFTVTAFYEIIPRDSLEEIPDVDDLIYQENDYTDFEDLMTIKLRYKEPTSDESKLIEKVIKVTDITDEPSENFMFASAVAEFSLLLRDSEYKSDANYAEIIDRATISKGIDVQGYRAEFIRIVGLANEIQKGLSR